MNNQLDLRKKLEYRTIERIIFKTRPWYIELVKVLLAVIIATGAVYVISKADEISSGFSIR